MVSQLAADRSVTWPLLTGNDTLVFESHAATLANKTLTSPILTSPSIGATDLKLERDAADTLAQRRATNAQTLRVYTTWTDSSNYERLALSGAAIAAETAGTGTDNINLTLTPAGTGQVIVGGGADLKLTGFVQPADAGARYVVSEAGRLTGR